MKKFCYNTPIGNLWIAEKEEKIVQISFSEIADGKIQETELLRKTYLQLSEYFNKKRQHFDIPLLIEGTDFQKKVWLNLAKIPYGQTISYKKLAEMCESPKAYRAVGMANNKNKLPIIIPCHRVIGSNGELTGYAGGINIKKYLLNLEAKTSQI